MKRAVRWVLALVVLLVAVFYLGGGWYFSGEIDKGALQVRHDPPNRAVKVVATSTDEVSLVVRAGEEERALATSMTYGLSWSGGYGQVSGPARRTGSGVAGEVTRQLRVLTGTPPRVGQVATMMRDAFPADAPRIAVPSVREVEYTSGGRAYPAWSAPGQGSTWAVLVHGGLGAGRAEALRAMLTTTRLRLPSLAITYRNDLGVRGDPSGHYQYGRTEWRELEGAVRYATAQGAQDIVLIGFSMGGAISASFLEHSPLADRVVKLVLDSPMLDLASVVEHGAAQRTLPLIGPLPGSLTWTAERLTSLRADVDWGRVDYLEPSAWLTVPTLVFHGAQDRRVPVSVSRTLARQHPDLVTLEVVPHADHVQAWNRDPAAYDRVLGDFLGSGR